MNDVSTLDLNSLCQKIALLLVPENENCTYFSIIFRLVSQNWTFMLDVAVTS